MAVRVGGDGYARRLCVRETEEGDERGRVRGGSRGVRGGVGDVQGDEGAARQADAGVARRGAVAVFSSAFWQEEEDAPALGGPPGGWA